MPAELIRNMRSVADLTLALDGYAVPRHPQVEKAVTAWDALQAQVGGAPPPIEGNLSDRSHEELMHTVEARAVRLNTNAMAQATNELQGRLLAEACEALTEHIPVILKKLRPRFDKAAAEVHVAAQAGIVPNMTAQAVIDLERDDALKAWRSLDDHLTVLQEIARFRVDLSLLLDLAPTINHHQYLYGDRVNYTACFTAASTNVTFGYQPNAAAHQWLSLAIATRGKLRLNSPAETEAILHGDGEVPGYIVCAAACVVHDDDGRDLHLYREYGDWVPSWVDVDQLSHLIDTGVVIAAKPDAIRPTDKHPLGSEGGPLRRRPVTGELVVQ